MSSNNRTNGHNRETIDGLSRPTADSPEVQDGVTDDVQRLVGLCGALLHQQLRRNADQEPFAHDQARLAARFQREVHDVLEDALNDGAGLLEDASREAGPDVTQSDIERDPTLHQPSAADGAGEETSDALPEGLCGGTVELHVEAHESVQRVFRFVRALRDEPDFRLLKLVGNHKDGVGIWLQLLKPLRPVQALLRIDGVYEVEASLSLEQESGGLPLNVRLA